MGVIIPFKNMKCALIGQRSTQKEKDLMWRLFQNVEDLISRGYNNFYVGNEEGFDTLALQCLNNLKETHNFEITLFDKDKIDPYHISLRNERMIDNCDYILALWDGEFGETCTAIDYCREKDKNILIIFAKLEYVV